MKLTPLLAVALALAVPASSQTNGSRAVYKARFELTWSPQTHPGAYPNGAHVSRPVGASHRVGTHLWQAGGIASPGMEAMAEAGTTGGLIQEIDAEIAAGNALQSFLGNSFDAPGARMFNVIATDEFPAVTLVTMVAPSPDWFVGVDGAMLLQDGVWVDELVVPLVVWDAGTDSGTDFTSLNDDTDPQDPITLQTGGPFEPSNPIGTLTFTRRRSTLVYGSGINPAGSMQVGGDPRLGNTITLRLDDPLAVMPTPAEAFVLVSTGAIPTFPVGRVLPGHGLAGPNADGELLVGGALRRAGAGTFTGAPIDFDIDLPTSSAFVGTALYVQGVFLDPSTGRRGLTDAAEILVGP